MRKKISNFILILFIFSFLGLLEVEAGKKQSPPHKTVKKVQPKAIRGIAHKKKSNPSQKLAKLKFHPTSLKPKKSEQQKELVEEKPSFYDEILYRDDDYILQIRAREFKQGNLAFLKIYSNLANCTLDLENYKVYWREQQISVIPYKNYYIAFLPIHPEEKVGIHYLDVEKILETKIVRKKFPIEIEKSFFPERKLYSLFKIPKPYKPLPQETLDFIQQCEKKKREVFGLNTENKLEGDFVKPLSRLFVTSPFYVKRKYGPRKVRKHGGVDFKGRIGEPIYAIQSGKVVIAERMYFEGIFTVIDHGNKMFTMYMHQSKLHVKEGDFVKKGTLIGEVGSTGVSTGPHLHLGLKVNDIVVNPLSVIELNLF
jgi:murein DD-endopeptidase MepM/ murein hydrolase activator NlpD